jgi:hypothetical protein
MEQDMKGISTFYADIEGKYPEKDQMDLLKTECGLKISGIKS